MLLGRMEVPGMAEDWGSKMRRRILIGCLSHQRWPLKASADAYLIRHSKMAGLCPAVWPWVGDAWDGRGLREVDEQGNPYRLPVISDMALEGKH